MSNRVEFDLSRKRYGHHQAPKVLPADPDFKKAEIMTWEQFDALYDAIKAELGDAWMDKESFPCLDRTNREREAGQ